MTEWAMNWIVLDMACFGFLCREVSLFKTLVNWSLINCDTKWPFCPWPSHTEKRCVSEMRLVSQMKLSWFVLFGFEANCPCLVRTLNDNLNYKKSGFLCNDWADLYLASLLGSCLIFTVLWVLLLDSIIELFNYNDWYCYKIVP